MRHNPVSAPRHLLAVLVVRRLISIRAGNLSVQEERGGTQTMRCRLPLARLDDGASWRGEPSHPPLSNTRRTFDVPRDGHTAMPSHGPVPTLQEFRFMPNWRKVMPSRSPFGPATARPEPCTALIDPREPGMIIITCRPSVNTVIALTTPPSSAVAITLSRSAGKSLRSVEVEYRVSDVIGPAD